MVQEDVDFTVEWISLMIWEAILIVVVEEGLGKRGSFDDFPPVPLSFRHSSRLHRHLPET